MARRRIQHRAIPLVLLVTKAPLPLGTTLSLYSRSLAPRSAASLEPTIASHRYRPLGIQLGRKTKAVLLSRMCGFAGIPEVLEMEARKRKGSISNGWECCPPPLFRAVTGSLKELW